MKFSFLSSVSVFYSNLCVSVLKHWIFFADNITHSFAVLRVLFLDSRIYGIPKDNATILFDDKSGKKIDNKKNTHITRNFLVDFQLNSELMKCFFASCVLTYMENV